jgi:uncharacterized alpha-E superfamily protein
MLSRVAESIYWMSRQIERAENMARFLETTSFLILDQPDLLIDPWWPLVQVTADTELFQKQYNVADRSSVTRFIAFDRKYHSSMISSLAMARENARSVREVLSSEVYEAINDFYQYVKSSADSPETSPDDFLVQAREYAIQWTGVLDSTMPRDTAWHFANVGRLVERADKSSRILDVKYFQLLPEATDVGTAIDDLQWAALLRACSGVEAYRRMHHSIEIPKVIDFFLFNEVFPRSVEYCVSNTVWSLKQIASQTREDHDTTALALTQNLLDELVETDVQYVVAMGMHEFVDQLQCRLNDIGSALNLDYFFHPVAV